MTIRAADCIFESLIETIMGGQLAPGEPLIEQALAEKFGVSRTPVREALHRLAQAGLAERGTRRAYFVREMTPEDLAELFEATGEIESALAALAAKRMSEIERRQLMAIVESGDACDDPAIYSEINRQFHEAIKVGARNTTLAATLDELSMRTFAWRTANFREDSRRLASSRSEHRQIAEAILNLDVDLTRRLVCSHVASSYLVSSDILARRKTELGGFAFQRLP
ncbi:GntR family transcriptional regulator [Sulfitobacter pseudonitzschiae]|nr:GntR family transcriptional regulator [Pseudosulfitobacter pseudonitzschiae]MBM1816748.1 GntR family transcriptional regulator [Pseudosulfitobacter pseudonitzschiae]MBM1833558.1 GntR family transcriptional regulator [Pseudosulfitobacter pseudonitzschiae]MBM1838425.1 GntR family transcriptional regulator [Pseudosulfitobacter pseudonitzschiae]MBM1843475.1 GntR family transcriptional regulator [Pseudosulfitobacter pseudonitzschiae]MBM1848341.1 GntR family transcriptional regulator [Pseudosulfi